MYQNKRISLILPCLNEEKGLEAVLQKTPRFVDEVLVVDSGSSDASKEAAHFFGARVISTPRKGYGSACQSGLTQASGDIIAVLDADGTYPVRCLEPLIQPLALDACDFTSGCRFPLSQSAAMNPGRRFTNLFLSALIRRHHSIQLMDSQSGMFAMRRFTLPFILSSNQGMGFRQEVKIHAWKEPALRSREIWIPYRRRLGRVKYRFFRDSLRSAYHVFRPACLSPG